MKRIIDVVIFLGERGLPFRGSSQRIYDLHNGNFLGILELIAHYDPFLQEHVTKVYESQKNNKRLQVHYLSSESQNEFIELCANEVRQCVVKEVISAKYYAIIVDATPDVAHVEQTTFVLRYLLKADCGNEYEIKERFLRFVNCNEKTGEQIAAMILETLRDNHIPIQDCRAQAYDNGANMSEKYNGAQRHILDNNALCLFSPCGCHSLNLCGVDAAACNNEAVTFFGVVQTVYNLFSCSPTLWEILLQNIGSSLHSLSETRWTARVASVRPFAAHLPGIESALRQLLTLNLTPKTRYEINGAITYLTSFTCIVMASVWLKVLIMIDYRNQVIQVRDATIDVEVQNLKSLADDLKKMRNSQRHSILAESKQVSSAMNIKPEFSKRRCTKRKRFHDELDDVDDDVATNDTNLQDNSVDSAVESQDECMFRRTVFYNIMDSVIAGLSTRFFAIHEINTMFSFLWNYRSLPDVDLCDQAKCFAERYSSDVVADDLVQELKHLKAIDESNFGSAPTNPMTLLNNISSFKLEEVFSNVVIALRLFCTIPVTVASAERSFSKLAHIKNFLRSTMSQPRLTSLGTLAIESELARQVNFKNIISIFASQKARRAFLKQ